MYDIKAQSAKQLEFIRAYKKRKCIVLFSRTFLLIFFLFLWELCAKSGIIDEFIFSCPSAIITSAIQMLSDGSLLYHIWITLSETVTGFVIGTIIGTAAATLLWWNKTISDILQPYLVVLNSLPKTALAPIIALLTSVIITIMSVLQGFIETDSDKIKLIRIFGGTKPQILKEVVFPSNIPVIFNALKINIGLSFVGVIVGEFLVGKAGLGYLIVYSSQVFKLDRVMLSVAVLAIMAAVMYRIITAVENKFISKH